MAFIDEQDDEEKGQMGASPAPGQPGAAPQAGQTDPQAGGGQGAFIGAGQTAQQQAPEQSGGKTKGSGMFTDVRKYVQANKPQAQKISGAVQEGIQGQAQQTRQALEKKSKSFQDRIAEQRARLGQAQSFAQQQLQRAQQGQQAQDLSRFRNLATGKQKFQVADTMNTARQKLDAQRLAKQAALSETAQGARNLLGQTFGRGQRYTGGQKSLDELILGGQKGARQDIVTTAQQAAEDVRSQLRQARQQATEGRSDLLGEGQEFTKNLQDQLSGAREQVQQDIQRTVAERRQDLINKQNAFEDALASGSLTREQLLQFVPQKKVDQLASAYEQNRDRILGKLGHNNEKYKVLGFGGPTGTNNWFKSFSTAAAKNPEVQTLKQLGNLFNEGRNMHQIDKVREMFSPYMSEAEIVDSIRGGYQDPKDFERRIVDTYGSRKMRRYGDVYTGSAINPLDSLRSKIGNAKMSSNQLVDEFLSRANTQKRRDLGQYFSRTPEEQIQAGNVITDSQLAKQDALAALAGLEGEGIRRKGKVPKRSGSLDIVNALRKLGSRRV